MSYGWLSSGMSGARAFAPKARLRELAGALCKLARIAVRFFVRAMDPLRVRLMMLIGLALVPVIIYELALAIHGQKEAERQGWAILGQAATATARHTALVPNTQRILSGLAYAPRTKLAAIGGDPTPCNAFIRSFLTEFPELSDMGVINAEGIVTCHGNLLLGSRSFSNSSWVEGLKKNEKFVVGPFTSEQTTGESIVVAAAPIFGTDNVVEGAVFATIRTAALERAVAQIASSDEAAVFLVDSNGVIIGGHNAAELRAASSDDTPLSGLTAAKLTLAPGLLVHVQAGRVVQFQVTSAADNYMMTAVDLYGGELHALLGLPKHAAVIWNAAYVVAFLVGPLATLAIALLVAGLGSEMLIARRMRNLARIAVAYGRGDFSRRPVVKGGVREIRQFAETLSQVADRISAREQDLHRSLEEKEILLKEVHHRVKNNLQIVSSFLNLQSKGIRDESARSALMNARSRVGALALVHRYLYESSDIKLMNFRSFAGSLVRQICDAQGIRPPAVNVHLELEAISVRVEQAIPLALFLTEALSNAVRHGLSRSTTGNIWISFREHGDEMLLLEVADDGPGIKGHSDCGKDDSSAGIGLSLMDGFAKQLQGEMKIHGPPGARVCLCLPRAPTTTEPLQS